MKCIGNAVYPKRPKRVVRNLHFNKGSISYKTFKLEYF